jgi:hypothetical protein
MNIPDLSKIGKIFPKRNKPKEDDRIDYSKEYSEDEVESLQKKHDDVELRLKIAKLTPFERQKLARIIRERKNAKRR